MKRGFTLLEVLIYTALIGAILGSVLILADSLFRVRVRTRTGFILEQNLRHAMVTVVSRVHEADDITLPASGAGTTLVLDMHPPAEDPTTIELTGGVLMIQSGSGASLPLTSLEVEITDATFSRLTGTPASVQVSLTGQLRDVAAMYQSTLTVTDTATIRR